MFPGRDIEYARGIGRRYHQHGNDPAMVVCWYDQSPGIEPELKIIIGQAPVVGKIIDGVGCKIAHRFGQAGWRCNINQECAQGCDHCNESEPKMRLTGLETRVFSIFPLQCLDKLLFDLKAVNPCRQVKLTSCTYMVN